MIHLSARSVFIALAMSLFALSLSAQDMPDNRPLPGRRHALRPEQVRRRAAGAQDRGPGGDYFVGEKHQLVVLASFKDNPFLGDSAATMAQWNTILNTVQLSEPPFYGSLHDYFYDQSYGQFDLVCDLQYVRVDSCRRYSSTRNDDENSQYLVQDIMKELIRRNIEWDRYDWNGDSYVNQLLIVFAGQGSKYGGMGPSFDAIWPHQWWLSMHLKDRQQDVYCDPVTVNYQSCDFIVDAYCAVQELDVDSTYGAFGTLCHEYTHCFGFPDFYYSGSVIDDWDLMDHGNYAGEGFRPVGYSAHERWLMGWLTPVELTQPTAVTDMPALEDQPAAYLIRNDAYPSEFYMVENRQQKGWDASLPGSGIAIFHIDYVPDIWITGNANTPNEKHYVIFPANNRGSIYYASGWAYPYVSTDSTSNNALTDTSTPASTLWHPNTAGTNFMSKPVTDMEVTDGLASFTFISAPMSTQNAPQTPSSLTGKILRDGRLFILREGNVYDVTGARVK